MHYVAVTRWGTPLESELPALSAMLGLSLYDCRLRASSGLPVVLCVEQDAARAQARVEQLRARGHGAVCCDAASVPDSTTHLVVRDFERDPGGLRCTDDTGAVHDLRYADIMALVRASSIHAEQNTVTTSESKLSVGRALMSGGLMFTKKVERVTRTASEAREQVLYVFCRTRFAPLVFRELGVRYQGLAELRQGTSLLNFGVLVDLLRTQAPQALYDARFLGQKRKLDISLVSGTAGTRKIESSNDAGNDLGAFLLLLAHIEEVGR